MTTIVIADDHEIVRQGLSSLLRSTENMQIVGECGDGRSVVKLATELKPDIVIMDVTLPDLNGVDATRQIIAESPETRVIGLSAHGDRQHVTQMLAAGASGYVLKEGAFDELARAIHSVLNGRSYLSPEVASSVIDVALHGGNGNGKGIELDGQPHPERAGVYAALTPREREVLQLLAEGHDPKQVGLRLHISVKTVQTHRQHIMDKLDLHNLAELTKYAIREGLTTLEA